MPIKRPLFRLIVLSLLLAFASSLQAQTPSNSNLTYGSAADGSIVTAGDSNTFTFDGTANDLVFVRVINLTSTLNTMLSLVSADGGEKISVTNGLLTHRLTASGKYQLVITGQNGTTGGYVLRLDARTGVPLPLTLGQVTSAQFAPNGPPQTFHFEQTSKAPLLLTVSADNLAFRFSTEIRNALGQVTAYFSPQMRSAVLTVGASNVGSYDVTITASDPSASGTVLLDLETNDNAAAPTVAPAPTSTPQATTAPGTAPTALPIATLPPPATAVPLPGGSVYNGSIYCHVSANGSVNIRSAPDASAPVIDRLTRSKSVDVIGLSADGKWFAVRLDTRVGWVGKEAARQIEPCVNVPVFNP